MQIPRDSEGCAMNKGCPEQAQRVNALHLSRPTHAAKNFEVQRVHQKDRLTPACSTLLSVVLLLRYHLPIKHQFYSRGRELHGFLKVLTNVGILTEGYDDTSISCVLMTKPTTSTGLYTQCVGRGLRPHPGAAMICLQMSSGLKSMCGKGDEPLHFCGGDQSNNEDHPVHIFDRCIRLRPHICRQRHGKEDCILLDFTDRLHSLDKESDLVTSEDVYEAHATLRKEHSIPGLFKNVKKRILNGIVLALRSKFGKCCVWVLLCPHIIGGACRLPLDAALQPATRCTW
eukprot:scaffold174951_cov20-Tisochrysis_lutea.AAC.1